MHLGLPHGSDESAGTVVVKQSMVDSVFAALTQLRESCTGPEEVRADATPTAYL